MTQQTGAGELDEAPWTASLRRVDSALAQRNVSVAELEWHRAYVHALRSRRWEGLVEVGNAYLRIADLANGRKLAAGRARRLYLDALFRARQQGSLDGVLRTADAFSALGDREVVAQCLHVAERVAQRTDDPRARERVEAFRARWRGGSITAGTSRPNPVLLLFPDE
jgi:hypothetical protein